MKNSTPGQLHFAPAANFIIRANFEGGGPSSDPEPALLRVVDQQIGLTERLAAAIDASSPRPFLQSWTDAVDRCDAQIFYLHDTLNKNLLGTINVNFKPVILCVLNRCSSGYL